MSPRQRALLTIGRTVERKPFQIPAAAVSHTFALLAMRGAGKSNALVRLAEVMYETGLPWVAIDPKGDWWGIRSSRDGKRPGLSIYVFGGLHGDMPLEPTAGAFMADLIFDNNLTCLLDVSQFTKGEQVRFLAEFAERLYRRHQTTPTPRHIFMEEAEEYIPQSFSTRTDGGYMARCVGAWSKIVKLGRAFGIGVTMATQRSASLNKNVLTQTESLILLRTPSPQDQAQIKGWVKYHSASVTIMESLSGLDDGEAWIVSPHVLKTVERIRFDQRETFDSGATPGLGQVLPQPQSRANIDLDVIRKEMAETIERIEATDPKKLQARVRELETQLSRATAKVEEVRVEVPVLDKEQMQAIYDVLNRTQDVRNQLETLEGAAESIYGVLNRFHSAVMQDAVERRRDGGWRPAGGQQKPPKTTTTTIKTTVTMPPKPRPQTSAQAGDNGLTRKAEKAVLTVLAQKGTPQTLRQVAMLAGYVRTGGGFRNALGTLRGLGYIEGKDPIEITQAGVDALGEYETLPAPGPELVNWFKENHLTRAAEKSILDVLVQAYPEPVTVTDIAATTGYAATGGGFRNALGRLRTLELASGRDPVALNPILMEG